MYECLGPSRTRIDLSKEQVDILEHAWEQGLTSASKKHNQEIGDLSIKTSISRERIEVWIGNRRAKQKRGGQGVAPTKKRKTTKGDTPKEEHLKSLGQRWANTSEDEKMVFRTKAKEVREDPFKGMSPDEAANIQINVISNSCALLHSLGYEIAAIAAKDTEPSHVFGSPKGLEFIQGAKIQNDFRESVFGNIVYVNVKNEKETKQDLSEQVRKIFNSCWASVSSKKQAVPYGSLFKRKEFKMEGLPDGIKFKDTSSYGLASLRIIISHKDAIKNVKPASSTSADVSDSPHLLLASNSIDAVEEVEGSEGNRILTDSVHLRAKTSDPIVDDGTGILTDSVHLRANTSDPIVDDGTGILTDSVHLRANTSDPIVDDGTGILTDLRNVEMEEVEGAPDIPLDVLESLADTMGEFIEEEQSVALPKDEIKMKLESGLYPVARIMGKKRKGRKHLYKIHWEGCKASEATWEPTENIPKPLLKLYNKK
ncbi:Hypothetical predicted protein [Mytilus galloprovincialis]|uniref:Chromo domain-containing protein n=1 Tax=Mytilus galloprovincialis TaxID=29158 RepID=A0A8B6F065_MYTGA|nr:Hypothetical predicted protein [Mytilus galloprovincialis]